MSDNASAVMEEPLKITFLSFISQLDPLSCEASRLSAALQSPYKLDQFDNSNDSEMIVDKRNVRHVRQIFRAAKITHLLIPTKREQGK